MKKKKSPLKVKTQKSCSPPKGGCPPPLGIKTTANNTLSGESDIGGQLPPTDDEEN